MSKLHDEMLRLQEPLRQVQATQNLLGRHSPVIPTQEVVRQFELHRQMLGRTVVPKHIQEVFDGTYIVAKAQRMMEHHALKDAISNLALTEKLFPKVGDFASYTKAIGQSARLAVVGETQKRYEQHIKSIAQPPEWLERLQRLSVVGPSAEALSRHWATVNPAFQAMEEARKSLERLRPTFQDVDFGEFDAGDAEQQEVTKAVQDISQSTASKADLKEMVGEILAVIEAQQHPAVKLLLWLYFKKMLEILISGAVGAVMGYYGNILLAQSPQAESKAVREIARQAIGSPELLTEYRYVSTKVLAVLQNPRARSPQVGHLTFGKAVRLVKKNKDFAFVVWADPESGAEIQGWVFARYLEKFK